MKYIIEIKKTKNIFEEDIYEFVVDRNRGYHGTIGGILEDCHVRWNKYLHCFLKSDDETLRRAIKKIDANIVLLNEIKEEINKLIEVKE